MYLSSQGNAIANQKIIKKLVKDKIITVSENQKFITFKVSTLEYKALELYCHKTERTKTDVLREFVRGLETFSTLQVSEQVHVSSNVKHNINF